jgi:hypothetical protein
VAEAVLSDVRKGHLKKIEATVQVSDGVGFAHGLCSFAMPEHPATFTSTLAWTGSTKAISLV